MPRGWWRGNLELFREQVDWPNWWRDRRGVSAAIPTTRRSTWAGEPGTVFVDPARLKTTILRSSSRWCGGRARARSASRRARTGDRLHLWVARAGTELAPSEADALFVPRRPGEGAGSKIGLFVARGVAEAQGGTRLGEVADGGSRSTSSCPWPQAERVPSRGRAWRRTGPC